MMASIQKQEADLLSKLEQKRDLELQPLRKKLNVVEACIVNVRCLKVSQLICQPAT